MLLRAALFALALTPSVAHSQNRAACVRLAPMMLTASDALGELWALIAALDFAGVGAQVEGQAGERLAALQPLAHNLTPEMREFLRAFDEAALALRQCAR